MEVPFGRSVIGKKRKLDILVLRPSDQRVLAIECKWQGFKGTTDEKMHYALADIAALPIPGCLVYAGVGWSEGVLHTLAASSVAAACNPVAPACSRSQATLELDYKLAATFGLWDQVLNQGRLYHPQHGDAALAFWKNPVAQADEDDDEDDEPESSPVAPGGS
jgi:hypothetical protein